ncbi:MULTISPECIES: AbiJ-NTD4 domain-containing protein [unclassified Bradyrhizobium]|uniref:AbiJ-NTD4 domain-containing protein n=1 Tax=unclassified Bradyrhizobium TaxID=2631580 RepID=UPI0028EF826F|nr:MULTISPECIES: hypothetical protein [unclassified Bradyrhizobium]
MNDDEIARRKTLTFAQAEGEEPLPSQLKRTEVSRKLRAILWSYIHTELGRTSVRNTYAYVGGNWKNALMHAHVHLFHLPIDEFDARFSRATEEVKSVIMRGNWLTFYGWIDHILRLKPTPQFSHDIQRILTSCLSHYRVVDGAILCPLGSDEEAATVERAFVDLKVAPGLTGGREHLRLASQALTAGNFADSVRESMHAVESVVRMLEPHADFSKALANLETKTNIHGALKKGFLAIYGFTSDEQGIRHALLDKGAPDVDEADALFMIGACSAFISYLLHKARVTGLFD